MNMKFNKRVTVHAVTICDDKPVSKGVGFDDAGELIEFIGHTRDMKNIRESLEDFEDDESLGRPSIYLHPWQWDDTERVEI